MKVKTLDNNPVVIEIHKTINVTKGTIHSVTLEQSTEEEIFDKLKEEDFIKVERMKKLERCTLVATNRYIITFSTTYLPPMIKLAD